MVASFRLIAKVKKGVAPSRSRKSSRTVRLYPEIGRGFRHRASDPNWYLFDLFDIDAHPWDAAHAALNRPSTLGLQQDQIIYLEPDLQQHFLYRAVTTTHNPPNGPHFAWHLDDDYSQLATARNRVQFSAPRTRIAHIDTGYDPNHVSCPKNILHGLEADFYDTNNPNSAVDPNDGYWFEQSGHGTGTLAILAGNQIPQMQGDYLGGAFDADIVPIRISDTVILIATSALAQAINYATEQMCDVASISMGGVPSFAWSDAVNSAYDSGMCIVAAAGDSFAGLPTHEVIWPARFKRTIAACGIMADGTPYYNVPLPDVEGNWGPASAMKEAFAASTPHISWAVIDTVDGFTENGAGTSCSTPQVAAAAALWFEMNKSTLKRDWSRIEEVRNALKTSAEQVPQYVKYFGNGVLKANDALNVKPSGNVTQLQPDTASLEIFSYLIGANKMSRVQQDMFRLEATQRYVLSRKLLSIVSNPDVRPDPAELYALGEGLIDDPQISAALRSHLKLRLPQLKVSSTATHGERPTSRRR